ncbi:MAG TPA: hypothetical protein VH021_22185, partial [Trebonia sp.]|nr:hypothetical protein [Trebonia sp.]
MISALASADRSKYSHHSATAPANATTKDVTAAAVTFTPLRVAPMTTIDSPRAIRMNAWQRSAKWPPSIVQSAVRERPRPG